MKNIYLKVIDYLYLMSIAETIKEFNVILGDFLQQVSPMLGTTSYHHYYKQLIKVNASLPVQYFNYYVHSSERPLEKYILERDEEYFKNTENHVQDIKDAENIKDYDGALMEIVRLKGIYEQLSKESRDNVWDILQVLLYLSKQYLALKK